MQVQVQELFERLRVPAFTDAAVAAGASEPATGTGTGVQRGRPNTDTRLLSRPQLHGNCLGGAGPRPDAASAQPKKDWPGCPTS